MNFEQAVFTSAQTASGEGYQLVASSAGLSEADARALATWCPSHDAMLPPPGSSCSVNAHPLPTGQHCVSRTTLAGTDYSGRRGERLYTHCLIGSTEAFQRFANLPFVILRAAVAGGKIPSDVGSNDSLDPVRIVGRSRRVDGAQIHGLAKRISADRLASLLHAALAGKAMGITASGKEDKIFAELLNCLPVECRLEFSFSTGLKYSPRRPFRWMALDSDPVEQRHLHRQFQISVIDCEKDDPTSALDVPPHGWAELVATLVRWNRISTLTDLLEQPHPGLTLDDLDQFGRDYLRATGTCEEIGA